MSSEVRGRSVRAALVLVATFVLGGASGAGLLRWHEPAHPPPLIAGPIPMRELDLSPKQREQAHAILERHRPEVEALLSEIRPRLDEINNRVLSEVRQVLSEAQKLHLDELQSRPRQGPQPR